MAKLDKLKGAVLPQFPKEPVWQGPEVDGITFSLLSRFLVCRERFRLLVVKGLKPRDVFNAKMEYGNMWHVCEEAFSSNVGLPGRGEWEARLREYCQQLQLKYWMDTEAIQHWYKLCQVQFPLYVAHWQKHKDITNRTPLLQEQVFNVPYKLPSGRTVRLRGKWDSVDLVDNRGRKYIPFSEQGKTGSSTAGIWLQENKTKSSIDTAKIGRQLTFDLQTMMYLVSLTMEWESSTEWYGQDTSKVRVLGVLYNVVRRSAHKSVESFTKKITEDVSNGRAGEWFARWNVELSPADVTKFRKECLDPILDNLCYWYDCRVMGKSPTNWIEEWGNPSLHWRHPYGVWNILDEGGSSDLDHYLETGSEVGLSRVSNLFPELE